MYLHKGTACILAKMGLTIFDMRFLCQIVS